MDSSQATPEPVKQPVTLRAGNDELRPTFERLWQLYWHDLSEFRGVVPRPDGTYRSDRLASYFGEPDHHAHLIHHGRDLAGFVLTRRLSEGARSVYAFFVVRALRRRGVGHRAAREMLRLCPGPWAIAFQEENPKAARFWRQLATDAVGAAWREERRPVPPPAPKHLPDDVWILLDTSAAGGPGRNSQSVPGAAQG
ncbi:GNAT family N-acetyltransferase [Streptomyces meridianus]|uniref:GNAT family N-acetyltransferase n=1 Tax=Streptomyces meridianus TaxID=2938945 RepID=A0ABT0X7M9_9ACTN|nr:GNAT family N-acetyltransferase [Streptomyces meridianus]MCM2577953.1 GNAT family N-acetyltransferase [Streptomyces meridianus]